MNFSIIWSKIMEQPNKKVYTETLITDKNTPIVVNFAEKDNAKSLGARWDANAKTWYIPKGSNIEPFLRWYPYGHNLPVSSKDFYLLFSLNLCWKCGELSEVYAFVLNETTIQENIEGQQMSNVIDFQPICSFVNHLSQQVFDAIKPYAPFYKFDYTKKTDSYYWVNHCEHCNAALGDFYMHNEPEGAFFPEDNAPYEYMKRIYFDTPFAADCTYGSIEYFNLVRNKEIK